MTFVNLLGQALHLPIQVALADITSTSFLEPHPFDGHVLDGPVVGLLSLGDVVGCIQPIELSVALHLMVDRSDNIVVHPSYLGCSVGRQHTTGKKPSVHQLRINEGVVVKLAKFVVGEVSRR